jgi:hypothetical protein
MPFTCPVCAFSGLKEPDRNSFGDPSFGICPCGGTQFGYDDSCRNHAELRQEWLESGARWWSDVTKPPAGWDGREQLGQAADRDGVTPAPWTRDQVASLNEYQEAGFFHPFTCHEGHTLVATGAG